MVLLLEELQLKKHTVAQSAEKLAVGWFVRGINQEKNHHSTGKARRPRGPPAIDSLHDIQYNRVRRKEKKRNGKVNIASMEFFKGGVLSEWNGHEEVMKKRWQPLVSSDKQEP